MKKGIAKAMNQLTKLSLFIFTVFFIELAHTQESAKEDYYHQIYQKYNSQPTGQDVWEKALEQRPNREYTIVAGDTLWDVSRTLFMDGFFWSKIWSLNPFITNPHQISVGQVIHFYPGSGMDAPGMIVNTQAETKPLSSQSSLTDSKWWASQNLPLATTQFNDVQIPPPLRNYSRSLDQFPSSLPNWYFRTDSQVEKAPLEILPAKRMPIENILNIPYFVSEYPQNIKGTIYEIEKNSKTASERDFLFIDANDGEELKIGDEFTVIQGVGKIRDPDAMGELPKSYEVQGEVKIVGKIEGLYKAMVTSALFPVRVGAVIVPGHGPKMNLTEAGEEANLKAMIIGGENDTTRTLFGPQSIIYLNRGTEDGIKVNQRAPITAIHRLRHKESELYSNTWQIGEVKIVKVEKHYSTAVIMNATEGVMAGDIIGHLASTDITEKFISLDSSVKFGEAFDESSKEWKKRKLTDPKLRNQEGELEGEEDIENQDQSNESIEAIDSELDESDTSKDNKDQIDELETEKSELIDTELEELEAKDKVKN